MLVKLGITWVDPSQVIFLCASGSTVVISVKEDGFIGATPIATTESFEEAVLLCNEYASIVNTALQSSSFGGDGNEAPIQTS